MKRTSGYIALAAAALLFAFDADRGSEAQTTSQTRPVLAVPMRAVGAQIRRVPSGFLRKLEKGEESRPVEVLDLSVEVSSRDMESLPPSLQPLLHIGNRAFPVQRVEYSNWDPRNEQPINKDAPVGETQIIHFFLEDWQEVEPGQLMILSILSPDDLMRATGGQITVERINRILPELGREIPRYAPREFMKMQQ